MTPDGDPSLGAPRQEGQYVQAKEINLEPLLEGQKQCLVPLHQRTYAWQRDQIPTTDGTS